MTATVAHNPKHTSRAAKAKVRIMQTASRLFAERGYGNVGINKIGQVAGFGKGALYYHIRSKEDLLVSIISDCLDSLIADSRGAAESAESFTDRVVALVRTLVTALHEDTDAMTLTYRDLHAITEAESRARVADLHADYRRIWSQALGPGNATPDYRAATGMEVDTFIGMLLAPTLWAKPGEHADPALARTLADTILSALAVSEAA